MIFVSDRMVGNQKFNRLPAANRIDRQVKRPFFSTQNSLACLISSFEGGTLERVFGDEGKNCFIWMVGFYTVMSL